jgi:hypothetical protein
LASSQDPLVIGGYVSGEVEDEDLPLPVFLLERGFPLAAGVGGLVPRASDTGHEGFARAPWPLG